MTRCSNVECYARFAGWSLSGIGGLGFVGECSTTPLCSATPAVFTGLGVTTGVGFLCLAFACCLNSNAQISAAAPASNSLIVGGTFVPLSAAAAARTAEISAAIDNRYRLTSTATSSSNVSEAVPLLGSAPVGEATIDNRYCG